MNNEATVVMTFFMVRVFVVGAIMLAFPRIARTGLLFGTYLGEERAEDVRRQLLRSWDRGCALIMLVALTVGWGMQLRVEEADEAESLYHKLGSIILPMYYENPMEYAGIMRSAIALNGSFFTAQRMMVQYLNNAYRPAVQHRPG